MLCYIATSTHLAQHTSEPAGPYHLLAITEDPESRPSRAGVLKMFRGFGHH